jgi:hypothetical protein
MPAHPYRPPPKKGRKPRDEDIKISVLMDPYEEYEDFQGDDDKPGKKQLHIEYELDDDGELKPIEMEIYRRDEDDPEKRRKKRQSILKGLEPKEEYVPKWSTDKDDKKPPKRKQYRRTGDRYIQRQRAKESVDKSPPRKDIPKEEVIEMEALGGKDHRVENGRVERKRKVLKVKKRVRKQNR